MAGQIGYSPHSFLLESWLLIKVNLKEIYCEDGTWRELAQDCVQRRAGIGISGVEYLESATIVSYLIRCTIKKQKINKSQLTL